MRTTTASTRKRRTKAPHEVVEISGASGESSAGRSRSPPRIIASQAIAQTMPISPMTWNGARQLPGRSETRACTTSGVITAPIEAPLCKTLLPSARSRRESSRCEAVSAQGHCPASKKPSTTRHAMSSSKSRAQPVANPAADHARSTAG